MRIRDYTLELAVFVCGALVLIFELVGSRVLGPYFGTSLFVWTSIIGVILASLSVGYYLGGRIADRNATLARLSNIIFLAAVFIGITVLTKDVLLSPLQLAFGIKLGSVVSSILLFSPTSIVLGMVSPYAVALRLHGSTSPGKTVGTLYALSTLGSIVGTFASGFYLIPYFGTHTLLIVLTVTLLFLSWVVHPNAFFRKKYAALVATFFLLLLASASSALKTHAGVVDTDTAYYRVLIFDVHDAQTDRMVRLMRINNESSSAMFTDGPELAYPYTRYYHLARHFNPNFKKALMLGGAGYSFPKDFLRVYPEATIDVVEIDPDITALARQHFNLTDDPRLKIIHEDARTFLNASEETFDVIFGDAFNSLYALPYHLTTREAVQKMSDRLDEDGIVIQNIISAIGGEKGEFLRAEYATYKSVFPHVYLFLVNNPGDSTAVQNIMLVALKGERTPSFVGEDPEVQGYLDTLWRGEVAGDMPILTDDYAPVDHYINKVL